jgi:hypothetical protein
MKISSLSIGANSASKHHRLVAYRHKKLGQIEKLSEVPLVGPQILLMTGTA